MKKVTRRWRVALGVAVAASSLGLPGCSGDGGSSVSETKGRRDAVQKEREVKEGANLVPANKKAGAR